MDTVHFLLADIWFFMLGFLLVLYVLLDGFDLGVGMLSLFAGDERREIMMTSLSSVWDANETWLVLLGGVLFGAFPLVYGIVLHALYIPIMLMLLGLILRGVAFEFREHARTKWPWNLAFCGGSFLAAGSQGLALGAWVEGIPVVDGAFAGLARDAFSPFSVIVAMGVIVGYSLLGATYLIMKTEGPLQRHSVHWARVAGWQMMLVAGLVTLWTPLINEHIAEKWLTPPYHFSVPPLFALFAFGMLLRALRRGYEKAPFFWSIGIFLASFTGLATSLYPYLIPPTITLHQAASSSHTLVFMLAGIGLLMPIMMIYNGYQYLVFRGKVRAEESYAE
jgi:cytochrome d ubiquinol oxidase subunit II